MKELLKVCQKKRKVSLLWWSERLHVLYLGLTFEKLAELFKAIFNQSWTQKSPKSADAALCRGKGENDFQSPRKQIKFTRTKH